MRKTATKKGPTDSARTAATLRKQSQALNRHAEAIQQVQRLAEQTQISLQKHLSVCEAGNLEVITRLQAQEEVLIVIKGGMRLIKIIAAFAATLAPLVDIWFHTR